MSRHARLTFTSGPNEGDAVRIDEGTCRLVGRHLSEAETIMMDRDGNRVLDGSSVEILEGHLRKNAPVEMVGSERLSESNFERGSDIILADDSISRAHAMVFFDANGLGLVDLASTNGSFVNDNRVDSAILNPGDSVRLGKSEFSVSD